MRERTMERKTTCVRARARERKEKDNYEKDVCEKEVINMRFSLRLRLFLRL